MGLTLEGRTRALAYLTKGTYFVGLSDSNGELGDPNYTRQPVRFSGPIDATRGTVLLNQDEIAFRPFSTDADNDVTGWFIVDAEVGGNVVAIGALDRPRRPIAGEQPVIDIGAMSIGIMET